MAVSAIIFISPFVGHEDFNQISAAEITAIGVNTRLGDTLEHGVRVINIPYDDLGAALASRII